MTNLLGAQRAALRVRFLWLVPCALLMAVILSIAELRSESVGGLLTSAAVRIPAVGQTQRESVTYPTSGRSIVYGSEGRHSDLFRRKRNN